jgi:hypothetical protein
MWLWNWYCETFVRLSIQTLTVSLSPAEVVFEILVWRVENYPGVKGRWVVQLLGAEVARPQHDKRGREQAHYVRHNFAAHSNKLLYISL